MNFEKFKRGKQINLGFMNGWDDETHQVYKELNRMHIPGTYKEERISSCRYDYEFDVHLDGETYRVIHSVDSGD